MAKKICCLCVMFIFIFTNLYVVVGKETKNYNYCTDDEVKKASLIHITNVVYSAKENHEISNWSNGVNLKNIKDVYDPFGNVIMCIYELCDLHNNDAGYILLSKVKNYYAILSYQETESHFYHLANKIIEKKYDVDTKDSQVIVINSGNTLLYFLRVGDNYYDITTPSVEKIDLSNLIELYDSNILNNNSNEWNDFFAQSTTGHQTISASDYPITNPAQFEPGYSSTTSDYCTNMGTNYFVGDSFDTYLNLSNPCGHICATNITMYWKRREPTYCANLASGTSGVSTYAPVFRNYYLLLGGDGPITAGPEKSAIQTYFRNCGISAATATTDFYPQFESDYKTEINNGRPIALLLESHSYYVMHWVTVFGYKRFKQSTVWHNYIRLADGWNSSPNRYDYAGYSNQSYGSAIIKLKVR